jgi:hypothetical protein
MKARVYWVEATFYSGTDFLGYMACIMSAPQLTAGAIKQLRNSLTDAGLEAYGISGVLPVIQSITPLDQWEDV